MVQGLILRVVDGVVGLLAAGPFLRVFVGDDGVGLFAKGKMLVLDHPGVGNGRVRMVDDGVALIVRNIRQQLRLEARAAVIQRAVDIAEVFVDGACVEDLAGQGAQGGPFGQVIDAQAHLGALQHGGGQLRVPLLGDPLVRVVEVVVVEGEAKRQPLDQEGGQLVAGPAPLLFGVALDEDFVQVGADHLQGLFLQVLRGALGAFLPLAGQLGLGFFRGVHAPDLLEGVHVEGEVVKAALVAGHGHVDIIVHGAESLDVGPDLGVAGMEDMRAVAVHIDALDGLGVGVAADVGAAVNDQAMLACPAGLLGKDGAVEACADDEVIIHVDTSLIYGFG